MILLIRKRQVVLIAFLCCVLAGASAVFWYGRETSTAAFAPRAGVPVTVIVDPGHGGEDGGAVAVDGTSESQRNLEIALRVNDLLRLTGQQTEMTREEDVSIHSAGAETARQRKVSDLQNRVALVNGTENAVLLSIHQNSLPSSPVTHGAQVFWNGQEGAEGLAKIVQARLNECVNLQRAKQAKPIDSSFYLMKKVTAPGIIVECGFLSNQEETALLHQPSYQLKLAVAITAGYLGCTAGEEVP